jgi:hypothetical protein
MYIDSVAKTAMPRSEKLRKRISLDPFVNAHSQMVFEMPASDVSVESPTRFIQLAINRHRHRIW